MIRIIASGVAAAFVLTAVAPVVVSAQTGNVDKSGPKQGEVVAVPSSSKDKMVNGFIKKCEERVDYLVAFPEKLSDLKKAHFVMPADNTAYPVVEKNSKGKDIKDFFGNKKGMVQAKAQSGDNKGLTNYAVWASNFRGAVNDTKAYYIKDETKSRDIDTAALEGAAAGMQSVADMASGAIEYAISDMMPHGKDPKQYIKGGNYPFDYIGRPSKDDNLRSPNTFNTADALNKDSCQTKDGRLNVAFLRKRASHALRMVKYFKQTEVKNYKIATKEYNNLKKEIKTNRKNIVKR